MKPAKKAENKSKTVPTPKPRKVGRPSLGQDARNIPLTLKISMNEKRLWSKQATTLGMELREYILHSLRNKTDEKGKNK